MLRFWPNGSSRCQFSLEVATQVSSPTLNEYRCHGIVVMPSYSYKFQFIYIRKNIHFQVHLDHIIFQLASCNCNFTHASLFDSKEKCGWHIISLHTSKLTLTLNTFQQGHPESYHQATNRSQPLLHRAFSVSLPLVDRTGPLTNKIQLSTQHSHTILGFNVQIWSKTPRTRVQYIQLIFLSTCLTSLILDQLQVLTFSCREKRGNAATPTPLTLSKAIT